MSEYGPDKPCRRTACADEPPHLGGEHIDPRSPRYDGPDITIGALPHQARRAARALLAGGASVPEVVDMAEEILRLREQVAAVRVDADRQVRRAMGRALDCADHGNTIRDLEKQVGHFDRQARRNDAGRIALLGLLHQIDGAVAATRDRIKLGQPLPSTKKFVEALATTAKNVRDAHNRAWRDDHPASRATSRRASDDRPPAAAPESGAQGELFGAEVVNARG